ncbi:MAG: MerR family transcriptional regulator, copper efflux regulator [Actinomycetota bacterium]|nr:MerR family transcriptional regulator, copper efflux regulator [Actinomycetota bacterium]
MADDLAHIGHVAETVGLSLRTIRYYEEIGLVTPSGRTSGGFRLYNSEDIDRLLLIKRMKPLGYPLEEMARLLRLMDALTGTTATNFPKGAEQDSAEQDGAEQTLSAAEAAEALRTYAQAVTDRIVDLQTKVAYAEEFRDRILAELARYSA